MRRNQGFPSIRKNELIEAIWFRECSRLHFRTQLQANFREKTIGRIGFDARVSNHEFIVELSIFTCLVAKLDGFTQFDFSEQIGLVSPPICDETE